VPSFPLPDGTPLPRLDDLGPEFRTPLPPSPVWNPPGAKRVGLQAGHWRLEEAPPELGRLAEGTSVDGWDEWEVNLRLAQHTAALLEAAGIVVDVLPATPPMRYRAHAVVAIHADGNSVAGLRGFKVARSAISSVPRADDLLAARLSEAYGAATGLPHDDTTIGESMTAYYAFDPRRFQHALNVGVPAAILEAGYLTSAEDRVFLTSQPEAAARGIADGIRAFLALELAGHL
jgi:N-acetylmuramoyl-L-alanine amidase